MIADRKEPCDVFISFYRVNCAACGKHFVSEDELYFGQILDNAYVHSKFLAERNVT